MTEEEQEFDRLIRVAASRPMKGCKCMEAMLQGFRKPHDWDDDCISREEPQRKEQSTE